MEEGDVGWGGGVRGWVGGVMGWEVGDGGVCTRRQLQEDFLLLG